jgi:hypothetical protein
VGNAAFSPDKIFIYENLGQVNLLAARGSKKRNKTGYPGFFFIIGKSPATGRDERVYYIRYRKDGKLVEEKAGRQVEDAMTSARASRVRAMKISGKIASNSEIRRARAKKAEKVQNRWTVNRIWKEYQRQKPHLKGGEPTRALITNT